MTKEDIIKKLDEIFEDKKARNFINHLVRAYFPNNKVEKVFIKPKSNFKCVLTNDTLVSVNQILEGVKGDELKDEFFKYLHLMLDPKIEVEPTVKKLIAGRKLSIQGTNTDTFMSVEAYEGFCDWVITKILTGDKHIAWLLKGLGRDTFIDRAGSINNKKIQRIVKDHQKSKDGYSATFALGDLSALQELKAKMEK